MTRDNSLHARYLVDNFHAFQASVALLKGSDYRCACGTWYLKPY